MKTIKTILMAAAFFGFTAMAAAQYSGPDSSLKTATVKNVQENASQYDKDDTMVQLRGFITEKVSKDMYRFKDSSGTIVVEIDDEDLPAFKFDDKTKVILTAEVDDDLFEDVEVEVEKVEKAQ
jgi:uncharacterized protein (TIGR00156 family)